MEAKLPFALAASPEGAAFTTAQETRRRFFFSCWEVMIKQNS